jgi:hypothetical protein
MNGQLIVNIISFPAQLYLDNLLIEDKGEVYLDANSGKPYTFIFYNFTPKLYEFFFLIPKNIYVNYWHILMNSFIWYYVSNGKERKILKVDLSLIEEDFQKTIYGDNYLIKVKGYELL